MALIAVGLIVASSFLLAAAQYYVEQGDLLMASITCAFAINLLFIALGIMLQGMGVHIGIAYGLVESLGNAIVGPGCSA